MKKKYLTTEELAERWMMSAGTLKNWRCQRKGPRYIKHGRARNGKAIVRYLESDVAAYEKRKIVAYG